jgi:hypothetical protein
MNEIKYNNFGVEYERGTLICKLYDKCNKYNIYTINCHIDIPEYVRLESTKLIASFVKEILMEESNAQIIISGDFNSFANGKGIQQIKSLTSETENHDNICLTEFTDKIYLPDGTETNTSFIAYPYDLGAAEMLNKDKIKEILTIEDPMKLKKALVELYQEFASSFGGKLDDAKPKGDFPLDHIFGYNLKLVEGTKAILDISWQYLDYPKDFTMENVKQHTIDHCFGDQIGPIVASDHQPIVVNLIKI